ncbi:MAG: carbohydrate binding domain-containing protein [Candidatus Solibacter sp.]
MESTSRPPRWHYALLAALPLLLTLLNRNWAFENYGNYDAWYYFGDFLHFPRIHQVLPNYPHERVLWIIPGYALVHLLGVTAGVLLAHCLVVWACLFLLHYILRRVADPRTALLGAVMLGCNPGFIGANGWEYPEGLWMACVLASVALLVRRPGAPSCGGVAAFGAGAAWFGLFSLYPVWACLTPFFLYLLVRPRRGETVRWPDALRNAGLAAAGATAAGLLLWVGYLAMGAKGFFLTMNLSMGKALAGTGNTMFVNPVWYRDAMWLVWPSIAVAAAAIGIVEYRRRPDRFSWVHRDLLWCYLLCAAILIFMTVTPPRLLTFEFKTSVLVPVVFLTLALVLFRVPRQLPDRVFYLVAGVASVLCLAPLARPGLYLVAFHRAFLIPALLLLAAVTALRVWRPASGVRWCAAVLLFAIASVGIIPGGYGRAWRDDYNGPEITERVARSVRLILSRTPAGRNPVVWYQYHDAYLGAEFLGVMAALMGGDENTMDFPKATHQLPPGTRVFLLRDTDDAAAVAQYRMATAGMPVTLMSKDKIEYGKVSYWITQFEVQPFSMAAVRAGFEAVRKDEPPLVLSRTRLLELPAPGVYQIELRYPRGFGKVKFGAVRENGEWLEEGVAALEGDDQIVWFRRGVESGEPLRLRAEGECAPSDCAPFAARIGILRDAAGADAKMFNLIQKRATLITNLLPTGSFDAGLDGWSAAKGTIQPAQECHSGNCVEFRPKGTEMQYLISWDAVRLEKGQRYEFDAWVRSGTGRPLRLEFGLWNAARKAWATNMEITAATEWSQVKLRFLNDTEAPLSPIFWQSRMEFGPMLVDEVELKPAATLPERKPQMIPNGDFENGLAGWSSPQGEMKEGSHCHTGVCAEFRPQGKVMQYLVSWDSVSLTKGKTYELSAWIRSGTIRSGTAKPLRLQFGFWDRQGNNWVAPQTVTAGAQWTEVKTRFQSDTAARLSPIFWQSQGEYGAMVVDDVELVEVAAGASGPGR